MKKKTTATHYIGVTKNGHKLYIFIQFGTRKMQITMDKRYTTRRAAVRASNTIAKKFGLKYK
jgi:hypothetical protein